MLSSCRQIAVTKVFKNQFIQNYMGSRHYSVLRFGVNNNFVSVKFILASRRFNQQRDVIQKVKFPIFVSVNCIRQILFPFYQSIRENVHVWKQKQTKQQKITCDVSFSMQFLLTFFQISLCKENDTDFYYQKYIYYVTI